MFIWIASSEYETIFIYSVVAKCTYKLRVLLPSARTSLGKRGNSLLPFPGAKFFSHVKSEHIKFLHVKNIWDLSLFIEHDISLKKVDSFFSFCHFSSKLSYHSCQRVCKIMFPITTFIKTNSNLMCGSFLLCQVIPRTTDTKTKSKIISR